VLATEVDSEGRLRTKLYDKRNDFNIPIVNFRCIRSTFPAAAQVYGVYISKCVEISRTYQYSKSIVKTCKQLDVFLINYLH
jgi:hypothetical protein